MRISREDARSFLVSYHNLTDSRPLMGVDGIVEYIKKVGCIQYDPLNIIGRNSDLVLQSRVRDYCPEMLESLLYKDRLLIDGWDKMMSIYSREDWPYFHLLREQRGIEAISVLEHRNSKDALLHTDVVLDALVKSGPLQPKQIQLGSVGPGSWGHRNLSSAAMDYLFHIGKVGVFNKINAIKVYDIIERLLPDSILGQPDPFKSEYDFVKWYVYRRLGSVGMLWNKSGGGWLANFLGDKNLRLSILDEYVADGLVQCVKVEGISERFYVRSVDACFFGADVSGVAVPEAAVSEVAVPGAAGAEAAVSGVVRFIAPLDNLIWDRDMLSKLFGFDYTWEVYVPASKRKYGYYVIPVLYGNHFIARFEPEQSKSHVKIKNWWWEKDVSVSGALIELVLSEMEHLAVCFHKNAGVHESVGAMIRSSV